MIGKDGLMKAARIALSIVLGLGAIIALFIADAYLTSPGHRKTPPAAYLMTALYLALAQFLLATKGKGLIATRPTLVAMVTPVALFFLLALIIEGKMTLEEVGWWLLICCGGLVGAAAASICRKRAVRRERPNVH
jgi:hypothetical protein